mgnify:CR=1 FL=1
MPAQRLVEQRLVERRLVEQRLVEQRLVERLMNFPFGGASPMRQMQIAKHLEA